jgi:Tfp pilus assembly protein PilE
LIEPLLAETAQTPLWLTIVVAGVTAAVAVASAVISARASRRAARTAQVTANMNRFAEWQQHKRTVYTAFLGAGATAANSNSSEDARAFEIALSQVMVTADHETRKWLRTLDLPRILGQRDQREEIQERLVQDVGVQGPAR